MCVCVKSLQSCPTRCNPMDCSLPGSLSIGFSRQEYWSWVTMSSSRGSSDSGIKPTSLTSPALAGGFFTTSTTWEATNRPNKINDSQMVCVCVYTHTHTHTQMECCHTHTDGSVDTHTDGSVDTHTDGVECSHTHTHTRMECCHSTQETQQSTMTVLS